MVRIVLRDCDESSDICESALQTSQLLQVLRWMHLLDGFDFVRVDVNSFGRDNEAQELPA